MDVFKLRDAVVGEYREYVESVVRVLDPRLDDFVRNKLAAGELWPDAVLQLNPAFEPGATLGELAGQLSMSSRRPGSVNVSDGCPRRRFCGLGARTVQRMCAAVRTGIRSGSSSSAQRTSRMALKSS